MLRFTAQTWYRASCLAQRVLPRFFSPACSTARQQPTINSTTAHHHLAHYGSTALASPYSAAVLSSLGDSALEGTEEGEEDEEDEEEEENEENERDLSPGGEDTDYVKDSTSEYQLGFPGGAAKTASNDTMGSSSAPRERAARVTNTPHTTIAGLSKPSNRLKRTNGGDEDEGEDEDSRRDPKRQSRSWVDTPQIKLYVCPYQIRDPPKYALRGTPKVCGKGIKPGKLREHLRRHHLQPAQCPRCGRRGDSGQINEHMKRRKCAQRSEIVKVPQEILAIDQQLTLQPKTTWEVLWVLLFGPDVPLPHEDQRYIRHRQPRGAEEVVRAILDWRGPALLQAFLRSEQFQQISVNNREIFEELLDEEVAASSQMESVASMIEEANQTHKDLQTKHNTQNFIPTQTPPNINMDPSKEATPNEKLPRIFRPDIPTGEGLTDGYSTWGFHSHVLTGNDLANGYSTHEFRSDIPTGDYLADGYSTHELHPDISTGDDLADGYSTHGFHSDVPTGDGLADGYPAHGFHPDVPTGDDLADQYPTHGFHSDVPTSDGLADGYSAHEFYPGIPTGISLADEYFAHGFRPDIPTGDDLAEQYSTHGLLSDFPAGGGLTDEYSSHPLSLSSREDWQYGVPDDPATGLTLARGAPSAGTPTKIDIRLTYC